MRVIVAEDSHLFGDFLVKEFTRRGLLVTGWARTARELHRLVDAEPPDIVVLDMRMPRSDPAARNETVGLEAATQIRSDHPGVAILVLSGHPRTGWAEEIVKLGPAVGYQLKDRVQDMHALIEIMHAITHGAIRIDVAADEDLGSLPGISRQQARKLMEKLTPQQRKVLALAARGLTNAATADRLSIAETVVEGHLRNIYEKFELTGHPELNMRVKAIRIWLATADD